MNNVVTYCALLATAAVAVTAYNFEDPEFNQYLAGDLEDVYENSQFYHARDRRDDESVTKEEKCHPSKRWGKLCCAEDLVKKIQESQRDVKRTCFKEISDGKNATAEKPEFDPFKCGKPWKHRKDMICIYECVGKKLGMLDSDGNPNPEEFGSFVKESFSPESWLTSLQDKVISTCLDEAKNATANRDASDSESCNPAATKMVHCLFREIQLNCPAEQIKDEKSCARIQERMKSGHGFYMPPPPPGAHDEPEN